MQSATIPITKVLTKVQDIKKQVNKGTVFTVFSRSTPVFKIVPLDYPTPKESKVAMPKLIPLGLPNQIKTKDIYEKFNG